jgi:tetratricopeptide (TPR) repeat protein
MNLMKKLGFGDKEMNTIAKVVKYSLGGCLLFVGFAWLGQTAVIQYKTHKRTVEAMDPTTFYEKKSKDLLPIDIDAHSFVADYYLKNDQPQKAIDHILRIIPLQKANRRLKLDLATAYLTAGQYDKALACFKKLAAEDVTDGFSGAIAARLGLTLFYLGKTRESIETLDKCISSNPRSGEALCYRGEVEESLSRAPEKVLDYFNRAVAADSGYVEAWYQLARHWMSQTEYSRARICLLRILDIEPLHVKTHSRLGMVYYYLDQPEAAKKSYLTALALNPGDYNTHYNLGELYYTKYNDEKNALDEFNKAVAGNPLHSEANFKIGLICLNNNMVKEAITSFEKARSVDPRNIRVLLQLAVAYEKISMKEEALQIYKTILDIDPLNRIALQKTKLLSSS